MAVFSKLNYLNNSRNWQREFIVSITRANLFLLSSEAQGFFTPLVYICLKCTLPKSKSLQYSTGMQSAVF